MNPSAPDMKAPAPDMKNAIQDVSDVSDMRKYTPSRTRQETPDTAIKGIDQEDWDD